MRKILWIVMVCVGWILRPVQVQAQKSSSQAWTEYMGNLAFGKAGNLETALTYSTSMGQPKWRTFDAQFTPEWALNKRIDVMASLLLSNTFQTASLSTFEIREMLGARIHFTPEQRLLVRLLVRLEQRNVKDQQANTWQNSTRSRFRLEGVFPFNHPTIGGFDKVWYGIADAEAFLMFDKDVKERFANRLRFRTGVGYKFNHSFRAEFVYMLQASVNPLEGGVDSRENIFRFRLKHYFQRKKTQHPEGSGN